MPCIVGMTKGGPTISLPKVPMVAPGIARVQVSMPAWTFTFLSVEFDITMIFHANQIKGPGAN